MHSSILRSLLSTAVFSLITANLSTTAAAQSAWQKIKLAALEQACRGGDQKACQQLAKMGQQPQSGQQPQPQDQPGQRPGQRPPVAGVSAAINDSGPFKPPAGTKIEETILAPVQDRAKFTISPHGVHVATVETEGSRAVVWYDGVEGPKFDEIIAQNPTGGEQIVFSPDGTRYAYCARSGNQFVVVVDGKELVRSSESQSSGRLDSGSCMLGFTPNSKHVFFLSTAQMSNPDTAFQRFVFDGKAELPNGSISPDFRPIAFSPDGNRYSYIWNDPRRQTPYALIVDGKPVPYQAGAPQWTSDSKHLFTQRQVAGGTELLLDGKPIARAFSFQIYTSPSSDMVVMAVTGGTSAHPFSFLVVNGKKVPGSDTVERGRIEQVVFSPDGKHYAALSADTSNHHYVITDGKRGEDYSAINDLSFTADSSTAVYGTQVNGKSFLVVGDKEFTGTSGSIKPVLAPVGDRVAAILPGNNSADLKLLVDGKTTPLGFHGGGEVGFSPDGAHYAYLAGDGLTSHLVVDGTPQTKSVFSGNRINIASAGSSPTFLFSPDSKHIAQFSSAPPDAPPGHGVFLDGKFILSSAEGGDMCLSFSPDSKHLAWIYRIPGAQGGLRLVVDGKPVVNFISPGSVFLTVRQWLDFNPDGSISFLAQDNSSLKRITVTLPAELTLDTMSGGSKGLEARR